MPDVSTIRSYLVRLGWDVDGRSARNFEDALKRSGAVVAGYATAAAGGFALVGGAFVAAAAAVVGGTVAMGLSVARQDLQYQLLGRRLFMTTDAVRKMDMATKALGVTLPEIIFGPPELQERYHQLMQDETAMLKLLGGDQGEKAFRRIRDIEFQFTRLEPAIKIFAMRLTEDVLNKMFGGTASLEARMKQFVDWFESPAGFVRISDNVSNVLAPAFLKVGHAMQWMWDKAAGLAGFLNQWLGGGTPSGGYTREYFKSHAGGGIEPLGPPGSSMADKLSPLSPRQALKQFGSMLWGRDEVIGKAAGVSRPYGSAAMAEFLALLEQESQFDPNARNARTGAFGVGQIIPNNWPKGKDRGSVDDQIAASASIFFGNLRQHHGDAREALHDYYGHGKPGPGEPTFDEYFNQWQEKYNKWKSDPLTGPTYQQQGFAGGGSVGPVTINISQPNATPEQIHRAVRDGIEEHQNNRARQMYARAQGAYA